MFCSFTTRTALIQLTSQLHPTHSNYPAQASLTKLTPCSLTVAQPLTPFNRLTPLTSLTLLNSLTYSFYPMLNCFKMVIIRVGNSLFCSHCSLQKEQKEKFEPFKKANERFVLFVTKTSDLPEKTKE